MRIGILTGTRPDIIKMAPLFWEAIKSGHEVCGVLGTGGKKGMPRRGWATRWQGRRGRIRALNS